MEISTIGFDLTKIIFMSTGLMEVAVCKGLGRSQVLPFVSKLPPFLIGIEACGASRYWVGDLGGLGHDVRLMPSAYLKRGKTDANNAEAICEAMTRPTMRSCR